MVFEACKHDVPHERAEGRDVAEHSGGHGRLAVRDREGGELPEHDPGRNGKRCDRINLGDAPHDRAAVAHELVEDVVNLAGERDVGGVDRMDPAAFGRGIVHANVVQVREQDCEADDELMAVSRPMGQEDSVHRVREIDGTGCDVPCMDDAVVCEQRRVRFGGRQERLVLGGQRLQPRALLYAMPEPLLEHRSDLHREMTRRRPARGAAMAAEHTAARRASNTPHECDIGQTKEGPRGPALSLVARPHRQGCSHAGGTKPGSKPRLAGKSAAAGVAIGPQLVRRRARARAAGCSATRRRLP